MAHGRQNHLIGHKARLLCVLFIETGGSCGHGEYLHHGSALGAAVTAVAAADIVCRNASLLICGTCQGNHGVFPADKILHLYRVANRINVRNGGFHTVIHQNAALNPQLQTCCLCQFAFGSDTDCQHNHVCMERCGILQQHVYTAVCFFKAFHSVTQCQLHTVAAYFAVDKCSHVGIEGIHQLLGSLYDGHIQPQLTEIFRQFQTDKAAACQYRRLGLICIDVILNAEGIFHGTEGKQLFQANTGYLGLGGLCTGRQQQLIVCFFKGFSAFQIGHGNSLTLCIDCGHLVAHTHIHAEALHKACGSLQGQLCGVGDDIPDIIRQTAVCIGNIAAAFKYNDFSLFIQSANTCRSSRTACHTANNYNFHTI